MVWPGAFKYKPINTVELLLPPFLFQGQDYEIVKEQITIYCAQLLSKDRRWHRSISQLHASLHCHRRMFVQWNRFKGNSHTVALATHGWGARSPFNPPHNENIYIWKAWCEGMTPSGQITANFAPHASATADVPSIHHWLHVQTGLFYWTDGW